VRERWTDWTLIELIASSARTRAMSRVSAGVSPQMRAILLCREHGNVDARDRVPPAYVVLAAANLFPPSEVFSSTTG
jgi:hypothetical protein